MNELELKYGCNPNQKPARVFMKDGGDLPFTVLNGKPGYINLLDAFNSFQLVRELKEATGLPLVLWDERRSTVEAHAILFAGGKNGKQRKKIVDAVAASLMLEGYLTRRRLEAES